MTTTPGNDELVPIGDGPVATVVAGVTGNGAEAYALKVYPGPLDRRTRNELEAELRTLAGLRTRAQLLVADAIVELPDARCALRMELCAQSLPELVESFGPLSVPDALALGTALADALAAAHSAGIVHGGVTPPNVLFRASGEPVLADFGLTLRRAFPGDTAANAEFLAPETLRDGTYDERTDLYGLGAVLYFALSGASPHQGRPGEQADVRLLRALSSEAAPLERADLPPGLAQLVSSLLAKNPDARPLDVATVAARLGTMLGPRAAAAFDDFAGAVVRPAPLRPRYPAPTAQPHDPRGELIVHFGPGGNRRDRPSPGVVIGAVGVLAVLAVVAAILLTNQPAKLDASGPPQQAQQPGRTVQQEAVPAVTIELDDPVVEGSFVELSWTSNVADDLDFTIIIAPEGGRSTPKFVGHATTSHRVRIEPDLDYCFQIQASNSAGSWKSQPKPIRGARC